MTHDVVARGAVALFAVLVIAWLGVMVRNDRLQTQASVEMLTNEPASAESKLRRARLLNPDTTPDVLRAALYGAQGERGRAIALSERVLDREPDNIQAWGGLLGVVREDPAAAARARAALRRLDPIGAARGNTPR